MRTSSAIIALLLLPSLLAGCNWFSHYGSARQDVVVPPTAAITPPAGSLPLPAGGPGVLLSSEPSSAVLVPALNRDLVWDQVVDIVDDYFKIEHEERVKLVGCTMIEGHIDTFPLTGATLFEPWRRDSVGCYNRLESTLQSIR